MQAVLVDFLQRRKNRSIAIIMDVKEKECDADLNATSSTKLRKAVLDQFNEFYATCIDVMGSLDTGEVVLNEEYLRKLDDLHRCLVAERRG
jgi:hypothetical protein